ncbi:olfactory receptor 52D1-like [Leptodactylus fuscus]|uniref:olfactory receptor 52D1-like n=1 Tax=Leptodactylus fuscus TaxID=238119 RepID=UPI003F4F0A77
MENFTLSPSMFMLNFGQLSTVKYIYCVIALVSYSLILLLNGAVIAMVVQHKSLQEPMYIFISVLCLNGLYGSTALFPSLLVNLLQKNPSISYLACLVQAFCIHMYGCCEMTVLGSMAYDRYVSICNPLRYSSIMTLSMVFKIVLGAWLFPVALIGSHIMLTARLPLCGNNILKIYCDNWSVVRLSCVDTMVNNIYGIFITMVILGGMSLLIFCSYLKIIRICMKSSKDTKEKALQTCTPHLITITNFLIDTLFEILLYRFEPTHLPYELRVIMSLQFLVVAPILNPLIYGLKMKGIMYKVREHLSAK